MPPDVVRILASSTVFVKASSLENLDLGAIVNFPAARQRRRRGAQKECDWERWERGHGDRVQHRRNRSGSRAGRVPETIENQLHRAREERGPRIARGETLAKS